MHVDDRYNFAQMFTDFLNYQRTEWDFAIIIKYKDGLYRHEVAWSEADAVNGSRTYGLNLIGAVECSAWTLGIDGSLDHKICTFFKKRE